MAKVKDNTQIFKDFLKNADDMTIAWARAVLVSVAQDNLEYKEALIESHKDSIISGELIIKNSEQTVELLGFDK